MLISLFYFVWNGFSPVLPYGAFYYTVFMTVLSPIQYFIEGIYHTEYGFSIINRIFGEYKFNHVQSLSFYEILTTIFSGALDAVLFNLFCFAEITTLPDMNI